MTAEHTTLPGNLARSVTSYEATLYMKKMENGFIMIQTHLQPEIYGHADIAENKTHQKDTMAASGIYQV
jgi:hypothetical protein